MIAVAPISFHAVTPDALRVIAAFVGLHWSPEPLTSSDWVGDSEDQSSRDDATPVPTQIKYGNGLYAWVAGARKLPASQWSSLPVIYVGISEKTREKEAASAVTDRTRAELSWRGPDNIRLGRAAAALDALPLGGPVRYDPTVDVTFLARWLNQQGQSDAVEWLRTTRDSPKLERFLVRAAIWASDVGLVLNSQFNNCFAPNSKSGYAADLAAWATVRELQRQGELPTTWSPAAQRPHTPARGDEPGVGIV